MKTRLTEKQLEDIGGTLWMSKRRWWLLIWLLVSVFILIPFMSSTSQDWWRWLVTVPIISVIGAFVLMYFGLGRARKRYAKTHVGWVEDV